MNDEQENAERAEFEKALNIEARDRFGNGYIYATLSDTWIGWQARAKLAREQAQSCATQASDEPSKAERNLQKSGVFKGAEGLRGLLDSDEFWNQQPYGTRLYYGNGITQYLHRDVLRAAVELIDEDKTPAEQKLTSVPDENTKRYEYIKRRFDESKTSRCERLIEDLFLEGEPDESLDVLIDRKLAAMLKGEK